MYFAVSPGAGTLVNHSSQSLPSRAASPRPFSCSWDRGSRRTPWPSSVAGFGEIMLRLPLAAASSGSSEKTVLSEHVLDAAHRLAQAMLVLDERDAHVIVAVVAEADAGGDGDLRALEQALGELDRAEAGVGFRDLRPEVHRGLRHLDHPADVVQALDHHVPALLIVLSYFLHALLGSFQGHDRGHLDRCEAAVVVVALDARQRVDQVLVAHHEA